MKTQDAAFFVRYLADSEDVLNVLANRYARRAKGQEIPLQQIFDDVKDLMARNARALAKDIPQDRDSYQRIAQELKPTPAAK